MMPPGHEGVNFPQMDSVSSLKGKKALRDFTGGFLVLLLEHLPPLFAVILFQHGENNLY